MLLSDVTSHDLILLDQEWNNREIILENLSHLLFQKGKIADKSAFLQAVWERENISETGFEQGIAIPHGKSPVVNQPAFAAVRLTHPVDDWPTMDGEDKVSLVFLLAVPLGDDDGHLRLLSTLSLALMDEQNVTALKQASTVEDFLAHLDNHDATAEKNIVNDSGKSLIVITSCSAGIAHTYMAAEALEKAGAARGIRVFSEKQGASGIEDEVNDEQIRQASGVIFAASLPPKGKARFNGKPFIATSVSEPLKDPDGLIERILTQPDGIVDEAESGEQMTRKSTLSFGGQLYQGISSGISYMIPVIVAAGLMIGVGQLAASLFGITDIGNNRYASQSSTLLVICHFLTLYGNMIMKFMYPVFAAYMAWSIADRPGLVPGFIGGAFAGGLHYTFWSVSGGVPSGFIGALILGALAGFIADYLNRHIRLHKHLQAMKPMLIVPGLSVLAIFFINFYFVDPVFGGINRFLQQFITEQGTSSALMLAVIIAALTAFDLGGPVNKSAGAIAIGLAADHIFPLTARVLGIVIPPVGIGLATLIDRFIVRRRVFDENQRITGTTSLILGFLAIGEGAIPFMLKNPVITISINIIGAVIGSVTAIVLGSVQWFPLPAIWGWPLVQNLPAYLSGMFIGIAFIALANVFVRYYLIKIGKIALN
ncbi:PTS fructose transporter subunit IIABC [Citrobacter amalonaticus]|uniref:protein-N(pi)-phosphohistidine--D-fructose phosphotransferase n=1 Tax=Citrobacter amalonaticus TaxID=35703 RepID=A0A2S4RX65_CITAM|nr:fructose-specific PTS transporter subunit EIIC [Citrobacter amalonaticus]POT56014.1 PTS fructose transporter subunit IIABC [Citrobacter amalonaticus]POT74322.1 PTS fructose transporter subunit IIABC [Citrobacter amalonaticus]POU65123.1 PTS fructose transporter subunit IIABC [Citrobacter amalonaticus]POV03957.1 PTS fructose transporter subunit IIABC [Citrobacter amalonaticus]